MKTLKQVLPLSGIRPLSNQSRVLAFNTESYTCFALISSHFRHQLFSVRSDYSGCIALVPSTEWRDLKRCRAASCFEGAWLAHQLIQAFGQDFSWRKPSQFTPTRRSSRRQCITFFSFAKVVWINKAMLFLWHRSTAESIHTPVFRNQKARSALCQCTWETCRCWNCSCLFVREMYRRN